uniref:Uncharacterized protein n=1 Tax=Rhizophora mucronata TaxID=61149 RepID=A0A2P2QG48_RHIMU
MFWCSRELSLTCDIIRVHPDCASLALIFSN